MAANFRFSNTCQIGPFLAFDWLKISSLRTQIKDHILFSILNGKMKIMVCILVKYWTKSLGFKNFRKSCKIDFNSLWIFTPKISPEIIQAKKKEFYVDNNWIFVPKVSIKTQATISVIFGTKFKYISFVKLVLMMMAIRQVIF